MSCSSSRRGGGLATPSSVVTVGPVERVQAVRKELMSGGTLVAPDGDRREIFPVAIGHVEGANHGPVRTGRALEMRCDNVRSHPGSCPEHRVVDAIRRIDRSVEKS